MALGMGGGLSVTSASNHPVGWLVWSRPPGAWVVTVVCRATFVLTPGEATIAPEQEPPVPAERAYPDGSSRGLFAPCDLVPMKPRADVVLVGHAFAPGKQPARSVFARLVVGDVDKRIEVFADRRFDLEGNLRDGPRFTSMPLVYERAAGGPDTSNPIGLRPDARDTYGRLAVPNLQPPGIEIAAPGDVIAPVGFGPIPCAWPSRRALLGASMGGAAPEDWSGQSVPSDLDPGYFNAAPRDQQLPSLREDERIALENLHPDHPELITRLPGIRARAFIVDPRRGAQPLMMRADTLWIDAGRGICTLTWRAQALVEQGVDLRVTVAMQQPGQQLSLEELMRGAPPPRASVPAPAAGAPRRNLSRTLMPSELQSAEQKAALPFAPAQPRSVPRDPPSSSGLPFQPAGAPVVAPPSVVPPAPVIAPPPIVAPPAAVPASPLFALTPSIPVPAAIAPAPAPSIPPPPISPAPAIIAPAPAVERSPDALSLVWFDPESAKRLRNDPRFAPILDAMHQAELDEALDDPDEVAADVEDRREVFEILARGTPVGEESVAAAVTAAVREDGRMVQPILLVAGDLFFPFDELEALKAMIAAASPHAGVDPEAKGVLDLAKEFLGTPGIPGAPSVAEGLATRIRETFEKRRLVAAGYLDGLVARALLGGRRFQQRALLGGTHVRASMRPTRADNTNAKDAPGPLPVYLGEALAAKLPSADRLRVRMVAEARPAVDQHETHPAALRALALAIASAVR